MMAIQPDYSSWYRACSHIADDATRNKFKAYLDRLAVPGFPVILDLRHLASLVGIEMGVLLAAVRSPGSFYRVFQMPKRRGGTREISAPYPTLLHIQRWILTKILSRIEISSNAYAYRRELSVVDNATVHVGLKCAVKIDIKDFFPSIRFKRVIAVFLQVGYDADVAYNLARLCTLNDSLPQGAATSPILSNIICIRLDHRLAGIAKLLSARYTRYADDIVLSGDRLSVSTMNFIVSILKDEGFEVNSHKSFIYRGGERLIITGLAVSEKGIRLPKATRRLWRIQAFLALKQAKHAPLQAIADDIYVFHRTIGRMRYWLLIEPLSEFPRHVLNSLSSYLKLTYLSGFD